MTKEEYMALAEIALTGFLARNFFSGKYDTKKFRPAVSDEMKRFEPLLSTFDGLGTLLMSLNLADTDRRFFEPRLSRMTMDEQMDDIWRHCDAVLRGLFEYDKVFPSFYAEVDKASERRRKERDSQTKLGGGSA